MTIKTAVIGFGLSARVFHLPFITHSKQFELSSICSSQDEEIKRQFSNVDIFSDPSEMIENTAAELIIICTPDNIHYDYSKLSLENNKHVVVEKPFVLQSEQGKELIELSKKVGKHLSVYQNRRYDGDFLTLQNIIKQNLVGQVKYLKSHFDRFNPNIKEKDSRKKGMLFDLGPHLIDQMLQLFGPPEEVTGICKIMRPKANNIDFFHVICHYPNHIVELQHSPYCPDPMMRFDLQGDQARFVKYGLDPQEENLKNIHMLSNAKKPDLVSEQDGMLYTADCAKSMATITGDYGEYYRQLGQAIQNNSSLPVTANDGLRTIELIELIIKSNELGKTLAVELSK